MSETTIPGSDAAKREWLRADDERRRACERYIETAARAFPPGVIVHWYHGNHLRRGEVLEHSWERVKVRSLTSDKDFWIYTSALEQETRRELEAPDAHP